MTLIEFLKRLVVLEVTNKRTKDELALLYDFTFVEAFKLLDKNNKGSLEIVDFSEVLKSEFGITRFNEKEIALFILRYDRYQGRKINMWDFAETFTPRESIFASYI